MSVTGDPVCGGCGQYLALLEYDHARNCGGNPDQVLKSQWFPWTFHKSGSIETVNWKIDGLADGEGVVPRMPHGVVEFESAPDHEAGTWEWRDKTSVALEWVAGARPWFEGASQIVLAGSNDWFVIRCAYPEFMRMWVEARRK